MSLLKKEIEKIISNAIDKCGFKVPENFELVRSSDRPDLSDFQSNIALALAKSLKKAPRLVAEEIISKISKNDLDVSVAGAGFINIIVGEKFLSSILSQQTFSPQVLDTPKKVIIDFGNPNVAKPLHVGHLRSSIIGETLKNIAKFKGWTVVGDMHLGDWGLPMGLIIATIKEKGLKLPLTVEQLNPIYPEASKRSKTDNIFMETAQAETKKLQDGDKENREMWKSFRKTSLDDIKNSFNILGAEFELEYGESDSHDDAQFLIKEFREKGYTKKSEGAEVIDLTDYPLNNTEVPPFIVVKSNGAIMYGMTDVATIYDRVKRQHADKIWYVVDFRQALHFHQVFSVAKITGLQGNTEMEHIAFGTVLGEDKKPLKTRNGDNVPLSDLINSAITVARAKIDENEKTKDFSLEEKEKISKSVAITAIKFADLINPHITDYVFSLDKFLSFEGKTGPYILYTAVRIKSLFRDNNVEFSDANIILSNKSDKALSLKLCEFNDSIDKSFDNKDVHIFIQYIYDLATIFNDFYHNCKINSENNENLKKSWLRLAKMTLTAFERFAEIIKVEIPERM